MNSIVYLVPLESISDALTVTKMKKKLQKMLLFVMYYDAWLFFNDSLTNILLP